MHSVYYSGEWVIVAVIQLVTLGRRPGVSHDDIGIFVKMQVNFVSSERTLVNCEFAIVVKRVASSVSASFFTLLRKYAKQLLTVFVTIK